MEFDDRDFEDRPPRENEEKTPKPRRPRSFIFLILIISGFLAFLMWGKGVPLGENVLKTSYHQFLELKEQGLIVELWIRPDEVVGRPSQGYHEENGRRYTRVRAALPRFVWEDGDEYRRLIAGIERGRLHEEEPSKFLYQFVLPIIPWILLLVFIWFFFFRPIRAAGPGNVLSFARSRARFITPEKVKVTFDDVAGIDEAKEEVRETIEYLKNPQRFRRLGARVPRGMLLVGPPGCGKTLLAKAIAGEANVPFLSISGSDFVEMFVGVGAARVRDLFRMAKEHAPCIVFLDEIDAVGRRRGTGLGGGHDEREQTLNQILVEMDGFDTDAGVIIMAATNRPDVLDPALLRPGRFDRHIVIDPPDVRGREEILKVHARKVTLDEKVRLQVIARATPMFTGADLEQLINEAAIIATLKKREAISHEDLEEARDRVMWGRQKKSRQVEEEDRRYAAIHEAGHALVAMSIPEAEPVHKVTIIPRGRTGGVTMFLPDRERHIVPRSRLLAQLAVAFGGRAAEEICLSDISAGAHNDIKNATELARQMVCAYGMSEKLGPVSYHTEEETLFLGREVTRTKDHSERTQQDIDEEVRRLLDAGYHRAKEILTGRRPDLDKVSTALLQWETLSQEDIKSVLADRPIERPEEPAPKPETRPVPKPEAKPGGRKRRWGEEPLPGPSQA